MEAISSTASAWDECPFPLNLPPDRAAFFAAYALEPFEQVLRKFCALPPLPVRAASKVLSPEVKAKIRKLIK